MRRDASANRERVLDAAEAVFGEAGDRASTEEVARRAGVGIATVFRHFPTKTDLIAATLLRHFERLETQAAQYADRPDPGAALFELIGVLIREGSTKLTLASLLPADVATASGVEQAAQRLRSEVDALLRRASNSGVVRADATIDELYFVLRALALAMADDPPGRAVLDRTVDLVCRGLRTPT